jgi:hypothetical protein
MRALGVGQRRHRAGRRFADPVFACRNSMSRRE